RQLPQYPARSPPADQPGAAFPRAYLPGEDLQARIAQEPRRRGGAYHAWMLSQPAGQDAGMDIRAVAVGPHGTLVRILTEDGMEEIFRAAAHFLTYQGIDLCRNQVRELYFGIMAEQRDASPEEHPEFDAVGIWRRIIAERQTAFTRALPA